MISQTIIFLIGLIPLLIFSFLDYRQLKVKNKFIIMYLFLAVGILLLTGNYVLQLTLCVFWMLLGGMFWKFGSIGGADYKILIINSIFLTLITPNAISGQFIFIMIFGVLGVIYGILANLILKQKHIPFISVITMTYI